MIAGALVFSKQAPDILWGLGRCLERIGALPEKLVWDREGAITPAAAARPTRSPAFCGQLGVGWIILDAGDAQAKGVLERSHRFMRTNFEPGRRFANPLDFQLQLDGWCDRVNGRVHRTIRAVPAERLVEERGRMRPLPAAMPDCDRRTVVRVPAAAVRARRSQRLLDRSRRSPGAASRSASRRPRSPRSCSTPASWPAGTAAAFAGGLTITDPAHQNELERQRARRRRSATTSTSRSGRWPAMTR